jgi:hypothetical protein
MPGQSRGRSSLAVAKWLNMTTKGFQDVIKMSSKAVRGKLPSPDGTAQLVGTVLEGVVGSNLTILAGEAGNSTGAPPAPRRHENFIRHRPAKLVSMHAATQVRRKLC